MTSPQYQPLPIDADPRSRMFLAQRPVSPMRTAIAYCLCVIAIVGLIALAVALLLTTRFPVIPPPPPPPPPPPQDLLCSAFLEGPASAQPQIFGCDSGAPMRSVEGFCVNNGQCQPEPVPDLFGANSVVGRIEPVGACMSAECEAGGDTCSCMVSTCARQIAGETFTFECITEDRVTEEAFFCPAPDAVRDGEPLTTGGITRVCSLDPFVGQCTAATGCTVNIAEGDGEEVEVTDDTCDSDECEIADAQCSCDGQEFSCGRIYVDEDETNLNVNVICSLSEFARDDDVPVSNDPGDATECSSIVDLSEGMQIETDECGSDFLDGLCSGTIGECIPNREQFSVNGQFLGFGQTFAAFNAGVAEIVSNCFSSTCSVDNEGDMCECAIQSCTRQIGTAEPVQFVCTVAPEPSEFICPFVEDVEGGTFPIVAQCNNVGIHGICVDETQCDFNFVNQDGQFEIGSGVPLFPCEVNEICITSLEGSDAPMCSRAEVGTIPLAIVCEEVVL